MSCYSTKNINSVATGIVNGTRGFFHSLTWEPADGDGSPVVWSEDGVQIIEVQVPWSVNMLIDDDIVPFTSCSNEDKKEVLS